MTLRNGPEPVFAPEDVDENAPKLFITRNDQRWDLRDEHRVLSTHALRSDAFDAALRLSKRRFSEIFFESGNGRYLHQAAQDRTSLLLRKLMRRRNGAAAEQ
jgi:hypothetical protein